MRTTEGIKNLLEKFKIKARFQYADKGGLYYTACIPDGSVQGERVAFKITFPKIGQKIYSPEMEALALMDFIVEPPAAKLSTE